MNIVFFGTSPFAVAPLRTMIDVGRAPVLVVTQKARPSGRGRKVHSSPVAEHAGRSGLTLIDPEYVSAPQVLRVIAATQPDFFLVVAYGQKLPNELLALPRLGAYNIHGSLLPLLRGAAPIQRAILEGFTETGVTLQRVTERMDAGPIAAQRATRIGPQETAGELHDRLAELGAEMLRDTLPLIEAGRAPAIAQDEKRVTHARKLTKEDGHISFAQPADRVARWVRGLSPWPGAFSFHQQPGKPERRLVLLRADAHPAGGGDPGLVVATEPLAIACESGVLRVAELMQEGRAATRAEEFLRGYPIRVGDRLT